MTNHTDVIRRILPLLFILFACSACAQEGATFEEAAQTSRQETIKVAVIGDYPPYDIYEGGEAYGIVNDMMKEVFARLDIPITIQRLPFRRALEYVKSGHVDAVAGLGKNAEREQSILFPKTPLATTNVSFFVRKDSSIEYRGDLREMRRYTIGTVSGFIYTNKFKDLVDRGILRTDGSKTVENNIQKLLAGRYDVFVANSVVTLYIAKQLGVSARLKELSPPIDTAYMYLGISKKSRLASAVDKINAALIAIREDGTEKKIYARYTK